MKETPPYRLLAAAALAALPGVAAGAAVMPYAADADTAALYHLDEATGAISTSGYIDDASANNLDLRSNNITTTSSPFQGVSGPTGLGTAASYPATGARTFNFPGPLSATLNFKTFTTEAWVRNPATGNGTIGYVADQGNAQRIFFRLNTTTAGSAVQLIYTNAAGTGTTLSSSRVPLAANDWYHIAATYNDQGTATANDGVVEFFLTPESSATRVSLGSITGVADIKPLNGSNELLEIGQAGGNNQLGGNLDEFRFSNVVRTEFNLNVVPEPAGLVLAGLALPCLLRRRR